MDRAFETVISECARIRLENQEGTWIVDDMVSAYCRLHASGFAHSVEAWRDDRLAGGLYGVSLGKCFFGESMFTRATKATLDALVTRVNMDSQKKHLPRETPYSPPARRPSLQVSTEWANPEACSRQ